MSKVSNLSSINRRTVKRLSNGKKVSVDRITGLVNSIKTEFYEENQDATGIDWSYAAQRLSTAPPRQGAYCLYRIR